MSQRACVDPGGCALGFDADGWLDLYLGNGECWRNDRGTYYGDRVSERAAMAPMRI